MNGLELRNIYYYGEFMLNLTKAILETVDEDNCENKYIEFVKHNNYKYNGYHKLFEATLKDCRDQVLNDFKQLDLDIKQIINLLKFFNSFYFDSNTGYAKEKNNDNIIYYLSKLFMNNFDKFIDFIKQQGEERIFAVFYFYNVCEEFRKQFGLNLLKDNDIKWFRAQLLKNCLDWSMEPFNGNEKFNKNKRIKDYDNYCITDDDLLWMYNTIKDKLNNCKQSDYICTSSGNPVINYNLIANNKFKDKAIELLRTYVNLIFADSYKNNYNLNYIIKEFKEILGIDIVDYIRPKSIKEIDHFERIFGSCKYSMLKNDEE